MRRLGLRLLVLLILALAGAATLSALRLYWARRESNPVSRGAAIASRVGCLSCHGPHGTQGLPDPALGEEVPTWDGGMPMMYVHSAEEVREYVLDGVSKARARSESAVEKRARAAIRMPGFRDVLSSREVDDVVAYFLAASRSAAIDDSRAARGRDLAAKFRCEACHGVGGSGGVRNPGSLKGYVPGWLGPDFGELVRDDDELRRWILDGGIERLARNPLARHFLTSQRLQMPAYKAALPPEDVDALVAYVRLLRKGGR
jgi:mono/diheme cytochrome c family protein